MQTAVVLFTRDLRVHDHPALAEAVREAENVVPLFVLDTAITGGSYAAPNRMGFLHQSLTDLQETLRSRGGDLVLRRGDVVDETVALARQVGAGAVYASADVTGYAQRRAQRLREACAQDRIGVELRSGVTVLPPGAVRTGAGEYFKMFTPYFNAWSRSRWRDIIPAPRAVRLPSSLAVGRLPAFDDLVTGERSPQVAPGGETEGRALVSRWNRSGLAGYEDMHDDLPGEGTSRLSPYLHFGCVSPLELAARLRGNAVAEPFVRQLCWRDFHHQCTAEFPAIARRDMRPRGDRWHRSGDDLQAWKQGRTGYPIVDAGMRQLLAEGWMHNRARLVTASFLTKTLYQDWRLGAEHFLHWLVDGDIANNSANWQWVAGTGTDTRPNRILNPLRQAERFDPDGEYVRRHVPELAEVKGRVVHTPWTLPEQDRAGLDYPDRIVDHEEGARAFREHRA
jgi:deoxyribodipyrimidine photo-lyase